MIERRLWGQSGRNNERINTIMVSLQDLWKRNPNLRFGQLLFALEYLEFGNDNKIIDPFHFEDDKLLSLINKFYERSASSNANQA